MNHRILFRIIPIVLMLMAIRVSANPQGKTKPMHTPCRMMDISFMKTDVFLRANPDLWEKNFKKKKAKEILANSAESAYPKALADYMIRYVNRKNFRYYKAYAIAVMSLATETYYLLEIPVAENSHMPAGFKSDKTIYTVMEASELDLTRGYLSSDGSPDRFLTLSDFFPGKILPCVITDPYAVHAGFDLYTNREWRKFVEDYDTSLILQQSEETAWPTPLSDVEGRSRYENFWKYYNAAAVATWKMDENQYYLVRIREEDNYHMPESLIPYGDMYVVMSGSGLDTSRTYDESLDGYPEDEEWPEEAEETVTSDESSDYGPDSAQLAMLLLGKQVPCLIVKPAEMYGTPDVAQYKETLTRVFGTARTTQILAKSQESSWPEGLSSFDSREANRDNMVYYTCYCIYKLDEDDFLLWFPAAENGYMPDNMKPSQPGMYMVFNPRGLEFTRKYDPAVDGKPE